MQFICRNVYIKGQDDKVLKIPIAHGEGRYYADQATLASLQANGQVIYRYCDANGKLTEDSNPNGSMLSIAGICNANRNVFGMMPHPERACSSILGNSDGMEVFRALLLNSLENAI
jgi:phosphoribosylformylglycinamidine synthase